MDNLENLGLELNNIIKLLLNNVINSNEKILKKNINYILYYYLTFYFYLNHY